MFLKKIKVTLSDMIKEDLAFVGPKVNVKIKIKSKPAKRKTV